MSTSIFFSLFLSLSISQNRFTPSITLFRSSPFTSSYIITFTPTSAPRHLCYLSSLPVLSFLHVLSSFTSSPGRLCFILSVLLLSVMQSVFSPYLALIYFPVTQFFYVNNNNVLFTSLLLLFFKVLVS